MIYIYISTVILAILWNIDAELQHPGERNDFIYDIAYYIEKYTTQYSYLNHGRDLNIVILTSAKDWQGVPTARTSFSAS